MTAFPAVTQREIRFHYDLATPFYRLLWGRHIHHGLWNGTESTTTAQEQLIDTMAARAVRSGDAVLDVGCGMGGSSIRLARLHGCQVTGITLSPVQRFWATRAARWHRVASRTNFRRQDAEQMVAPPASYDVVWSVECTEHLFDKPAFFRRAAGWLKSGGRMAICAWLAAEPPHSAAVAQQVRDVCEGFLCPSLGTMSDYAGWMSDAGLVQVQCADWTDRVVQTWEICLERIRRTRVTWLARFFGRNAVCFVDRFETILQAYRTGAMRYGAFVFEAPGATKN